MMRTSPILFVALLGACAGQVDDDAADRGPLGKADAIGSCQTDDGSNLCGGQSEGNCWCDDQCEQFGDCCADKVLVCDGVALSVDEIGSAAMFDALAFTGDGSVVIGKSVKFLIDNRDPADPQVWFMNANFTQAGDAARFHYFFAQAVVPGFSATGAEFNEATYWNSDKEYYAGTIQQYVLNEDEAPIYGIQFYPQDAAEEGSILHAATAVREVFDVPEARVAFVATGPQQTTTTVEPQIAALDLENLTLDEVLGALNYIPMQLGEAWGFLRIFPDDHDLLSAIDIPVFDELPLNLTVVAGTMTAAFQDASSHVNLKSKERGTPNMILRDASLDHERLAPFANQPIHLVVGADGYTIEPSTEAEVLEKLREKTSGPWVPIDFEPTVALASYDEMCPSDEGDCLDLAAAYGGKASGLGFLLHPNVLGTTADPGSVSSRLGYDAAPAGFGVPVGHYFRLVNHPPNADLRAALDDLIAREKDGFLSPAERVALLDNVQALFFAAEMPPGMAEEITARAREVLPPGTENIKIRSSANAEDVPGFDGAGLYDSYRARLDELDNPDGSCTAEERDDGSFRVRPRTVNCGIKGVYASLWNKRAIEERSFARLDHATAGMGLAVVRRYRETDTIAANSVVVTRVLNSSGVFGYTFSSQVGNNVVTNPEPGTHSETIIAAFVPEPTPATYTPTRFAKPGPTLPARDTTVMTHAKMEELLEITQAVERAYCLAKPSYYAGSCNSVLFDVDKPRSLDMEFKLYESGNFLCKQVREFSGR